MNIEINAIEDYRHKDFKQAVCFNIDERRRKEIQHCKTITGIIIINDILHRFCFSSFSMSGDIITENYRYYEIAKRVVVEYLYHNREKHLKDYAKKKIED